MSLLDEIKSKAAARNKTIVLCEGEDERVVRAAAQITKEGKYIDAMERALYNTVLAGIAMDGKRFFYVNQSGIVKDMSRQRQTELQNHKNQLCSPGQWLFDNPI